MKRTVICLFMLLALLLAGCANNTENQTPEPTAVDYDLSKELAAVEAEAAKLDESMQDMTQNEMNAASSEILELWTNELNILNERYLALLDGEDKTAAQEDDTVWNAEKDTAVEAVGEKYEGGSIRPLIMNDAAAKLTRHRAYEIAAKLGELIGQNVELPDNIPGVYVDTHDTAEAYNKMEIEKAGDDTYNVTIRLWNYDEDEPFAELSGTAAMENGKLLFTDKDNGVEGTIEVMDDSAAFAVTSSDLPSVKASTDVDTVYIFPERWE